MNRVALCSVSMIRLQTPVGVKRRPSAHRLLDVLATRARNEGDASDPPTALPEWICQASPVEVVVIGLGSISSS